MNTPNPLDRRAISKENMRRQLATQGLGDPRAGSGEPVGPPRDVARKMPGPRARSKASMHAELRKQGLEPVER